MSKQKVEHTLIVGNNRFCVFKKEHSQPFRKSKWSNEDVLMIEKTDVAGNKYWQEAEWEEVEQALIKLIMLGENWNKS